MNKKKYTHCGMIITLTMGGLVGWSVAVGNAVVPIAAVIGGTALLYLCKRSVTEVMEDELVYRLSEKASTMALRVFAFASALTGAVLIAVSIHGRAEFKPIGLTLAFSACALLLLYLLFYGYYSRRGLDSDQ